MPTTISTRKADGRHWRKDASGRAWTLQCRRCARYKRTEAFDKTETGAWADWCRPCTGTHQRMLRSREEAAREQALQAVQAQSGSAVQEDRECNKCHAVKSLNEYEMLGTTGKYYHECADCRAKAEKARQEHGHAPCVMDLAYKTLFPDLKDYGEDITGATILSNPAKYPGPTYFHLTKAQREEALELAKKLLKEERGIDLSVPRNVDNKMTPLSEYDD